ncbi:MAG: zinc ribbon domain-containing protein [Elusimicrobiota bacterium]|nr:zinc ribbon domain-containing protein [Elusimicrobiota bacterium]
MSAPAAILCTKCGAASAAAVSTCGKCGGRNARVCGACGFQNSVAKNYCDKCGTGIAELGGAVAPPPVPGGPAADIPQTAVRKLPEPGGLPQARGFAAEPGAPQSAPLPAAGRAPDPYASADPWGAVEPPKPPPPPPKPRWTKLRSLLNALAAIAGMAAAGGGIWHWYEGRKPENLVPRLAAQYLDALKRRDYEAAYAFFSESARKNATLEEFKSSRTAMEWTWANLEIKHREPGAVLLRYDLNAQGAESRPDHILFVKENDKWVRPYNWTLMKKVEDAFEKGNPDVGLLLAQTAASVNPRDPMARGYLCEAAYYRKAPQETVKQCHDALKLAQVYPSNLSLKSIYHLHAILADTYKNALGDPTSALDQYAQMLSFPDISPVDQCEILLARAESYYRLGRPGESATDLDRAEQLCLKKTDHEFIAKLREILQVPGRDR